MVRLKDIAAQAGVSVMTVSKALRGALDVSAVTKARIIALAKEMGYVPNVMARGLRNRTTNLLGVVISSITNPVFVRTLMALEDRAHELGYEIIFAQTRNQVEREQDYIRRLLARQVDGLLIRPVYRAEPAAPVYDELRRQGTPTVILGHHAPFTTALANVELDDTDASYLAVRHLLELGHRRIACFTGPSVAPYAQQRYAGYCRALREQGLEPDEKLVFHAGTTLEEGEKAALQFLGEKAQATAIVAVNDLVAIGAAETLFRNGLAIPGDVSLTGFGNILTSAHFRVPLTTLRAPKYRLGVAAMDLMASLLKGAPPTTVQLKAELLVRQSTAPPRSGPAVEPAGQDQASP